MIDGQRVSKAQPEKMLFKLSRSSFLAAKFVKSLALD
jgi:hypothetical protein